MISLILIAVIVYISMGLIFLIPFLIKGVMIIDEGAKGSSWGFRIAIIPGSIVFWPFLLNKWINVYKK